MGTSHPVRATVYESAKGLTIEIPTSKNWIVIFVIGSWLVGWLIGEVFMLGFLAGFFYQEMEIENYLIIFWIITWPLGGIFMLRIWLYMTFGKEVIIFSKEQLILDKKAALFYKAKTYGLMQVRNLSIYPNHTVDLLGLRRFQSWDLNSGGALKFNYGPEIILFASDIGKDEARTLLAKLAEKGIIKGGRG